MVKKILIVISMLMGSVLSYLLFASLLYSYEEIKYVNNLIEDGNYSEAYKLSDAIMNENAVIEDEIDSMTLRAYKTLTATIEETEEKVQYVRVYEAIDFVLYNIKEEYDMSTVDTIVGYYNNEEVTLAKSALSKWIYEECNMYSVVLEIEKTSYLDKISMFNSDEEEILSFNIDSNIYLGYDETEKSLWSEYIERYNIMDLEYRETGTYDQEEYDELVIMYNESLENSGFTTKEYSLVISEMTSFQVKIGVLISVILIFNFTFIYIFVIRKSKKSFNFAKKEMLKDATKESEKDIIDISESNKEGNEM